MAAPAPVPGPTVLDALALLTAVADELVLATARDTHTAIADRVHGVARLAAGPAVTPPEVVHKAVAGAIYGAMALGLRGTSRGLDRLAATGVGPRLEDDPRGRFLNAAVNGLIGDELLRDRPQLAIPLAVRRDSADVDLTRDGVAAAFPDATERVVVLLHGLCENEAAWRLHRDKVGTTYAEALAARGWTPVLLRANSGLPVRHNGIALAGLMQQLTDLWPVPVQRIALIGHSMGGLVMRSASAVVTDHPDPWTRRVSDVVALGTPHHGAPLAWAVGHGSRLLARLPETSSFGRILDRRSEGVRDLVDGLAYDVPPLDHVRYRLVAATLTRSARHPVGDALGDILVRPRSAAGRDRNGRELFPGADVLHVGRTDHFGVLNHPEVHRALERWLA